MKNVGENRLSSATVSTHTVLIRTKLSEETLDSPHEHKARALLYHTVISF